MSKSIQLLTFQEYDRKYGIKDPYDKTLYDYQAAWKDNASPDSVGNWPTKYKRGNNVRRK